MRKLRPRTGRSHSQMFSYFHTFHSRRLRSQGLQKGSRVGIKRGPYGGPTVAAAPAPPARSGARTESCAAPWPQLWCLCRGGSYHFPSTGTQALVALHLPYLSFPLSTQQGKHSYHPCPEIRTQAGEGTSSGHSEEVDELGFKQHQ